MRRSRVRGAASPPPKTVMIDRGNEGMTMRLVDRLLAVKLPLIGDKPVNTQVQVLLILLGFCFVVWSRCCSSTTGWPPTARCRPRSSATR